MTDADRARELLIEARKRIDAGSDSFICLAIHNSTRKDSYLNASYALRSWIDDMLRPYGAYDNWIWHNHRGLLRGLTLPEERKKRREGRLAWIDWMLTQDLGKIVRKYNR